MYVTCTIQYHKHFTLLKSLCKSKLISFYHFLLSCQKQIRTYLTICSYYTLCVYVFVPKNSSKSQTALCTCSCKSPNLLLFFHTSTFLRHRNTNSLKVLFLACTRNEYDCLRIRATFGGKKCWKLKHIRANVKCSSAIQCLGFFFGAYIFETVALCLAAVEKYYQMATLSVSVMKHVDCAFGYDDHMSAHRCCGLGLQMHPESGRSFKNSTHHLTEYT